MFLVYSLDGLGDTFIPGLKVTLDLSSPLQAGNASLSNEDGNTRWKFTIPTSLAGNSM